MGEFPFSNRAARSTFHLLRLFCVCFLWRLQCRVEGEAVFGEDVALAAETAINGALVLPHKGLRDSIYTPGTIVM
jgi:hypothetical protein